MMSNKYSRTAIAMAALLLLAGCGDGASSGASASAEPELASIGPDTTAAPADRDESDGGEDEPQTSGETVADPDEAFALYEACMADYGIIMSGGAVGAAVPADIEPLDDPGEALTPEKFEEAEQQCQPILDDAFGSFDLSPEQEAEQADLMLAMQQCLADEGYDIDLSGGAFVQSADIDFEAFDDAMSDCSQSAGLVNGTHGS